MNDPFGFDPTFLAELVARHWQEDPGYYALKKNADGGWLEGLWMRRADRSGVELHWTRQPTPHAAAELTARLGEDHFGV